MRDDNEVAVYGSDLTEHGLRGQLLRLYDALCYGVLRAYKRDCVFRLVDKWELLNFNPEKPDSNDKLKAVPVVWGPSRKPVVLIGYASDMSDFTQDDNDKGSVVSLKVRSHENDCCCVQLVESNNLPFVLYSVPCLPKELAPVVENRTHREPSVSAHANAAVMINVSIPFMSHATKSGLVKPRLMCRQPLSSIARKNMGHYRPPYCGRNLRNNTVLLNGLFAQTQKVDFEAFVEHWEKPHVSIPDDGVTGWPRFHEMATQLRSPDISKRGQQGNYSTEIELNNSVHVACFFGPWNCHYCKDIVYVSGIASAVRHLARYHSKLLVSLFTCPVCVEPYVVEYDSFPEHYEICHEPAESLCVTLDVTNTHSRVGWGMAMMAWMQTIHCLGVNREEVSKCGELDNYRGMWGGYCPNKGEEYGEELARQIDNIRESRLPAEEAQLRARIARRRARAELQRVEQERLKAARAKYKSKREKRIEPESDSDEELLSQAMRAPEPDVVVEDESWTTARMRSSFKSRRKRINQEPYSCTSELFPPLPKPAGTGGAGAVGAGSDEPQPGPSGIQRGRADDTDTDSSVRKSKKKKKSFEYKEGMQKERTASGQWKYPESEGYKTKEYEEHQKNSMDIEDEFAMAEGEQEPESAPDEKLLDRKSDEE
jgi:hypothetical protein